MLKLCQESEQSFGRYVYIPSLLKIRSFSEYFHAADKSVWTQLMIRDFNELIDAGCDLLVCPANTNHIVYDHFLPNLSVPWLHIADPVEDVLKSGGF